MPAAKRQRVAFEGDIQVLDLLAQEEAKLAAIRASKPSHWYCDRPDCDGEPHGKWRFCKHRCDAPWDDVNRRCAGGCGRSVLEHHGGPCRHARAVQREPEGVDWLVWMVQAGRGWGKTRTGAEWVIDNYRRRGVMTGTIVGRTTAEVRSTMVEGPSGIVACSPPDFRALYEPSKKRISFPNGAFIEVRAAEEPDSTRGLNSEIVWCDELASWVDARKGELDPDTTWSNLMLGLRLGVHPRALVTTTPRNNRLVRDLTKDEKLRSGLTVLVRGTSYDNLRNLSQNYRRVILDPLEGTRAGRQEVLGELLDEDDMVAFGDWHVDRMTVPSFKLPASWTRYAGVDYGLTAPYAVEWGAKDNDGRVWIYDEAGAPKTGETVQAQTINLHEMQTVALDGERLVRPIVSKRCGDPSMWTKHTESLDVASTYAQHGVALVKADNNRLVGRARVHSYLREAPACAYHKAQGWDTCPQLHVLAGKAPDLCRTMPLLDNDPDHPEDVDTTGDDHWYDALRYLLMGIGAAPFYGAAGGSAGGASDLLGNPLMGDLGHLAVDRRQWGSFESAYLPDGTIRGATRRSPWAMPSDSGADEA